MRYVLCSAALCLSFALSLTAQKSEEFAISGTIVDARGAPVAGARLGTDWTLDEVPPSCFGTPGVWAKGTFPRRYGSQPLLTDQQGKFEAFIKSSRGHISLTVFSEDGTSAAHQIWQAGANLENISMQLLPVASLRLDVKCPDLGRDRTPAHIYVNAVPSGTRIGRCDSTDGRTNLVLPPGTYEISATYRDMQTHKQRITVKPSDERSVVIELPATFLASNKGKRLPPWTVNAARGHDGLPSFESYRGKWLVVMVWSAYRGASVVYEIPDLIRFDRQWRNDHPSEEPPYSIVLLHSGGAANLDELDAKIAKDGTRDEYWGGKPLPFPVLLDSSERTIEKWQISRSREMLLFDPEGVFVDRADALMVERAAAGEVPPPTPLVIPPVAKRLAPADDTEWDELPVCNRRRAFFSTRGLSAVESPATWCRSLLWNPRQIYLPPATRKRLVAEIEKQYRGLPDGWIRLIRTRNKEFGAAIAANKIPLTTKVDLTAEELKAYEFYKRPKTFSEANLIANAIHRSRKTFISRRSGDGVYAATIDDLPKSKQLTLQFRKAQSTAFRNVATAFREAGTLTETECKAMQSEFEQALRR